VRFGGDDAAHDDGRISVRADIVAREILNSMKWLLRSERTTASELRALDAINERRTCADYSAGLSAGKK
jgi:hypothetical protein